MSIANLLKFFFPLFLTSTVLFFTTQPIFHDGLFQTMDDIQVVRIEEMYKELRAGQFPVRIASDLGNGAGYMLFNFYSPLVYYIGAFFHGLGFTLVISTKLVFLSAFLLTWLGISILLRSKFDTISGVFGSIIFLVSPYLGYDVYHRGALAEFFAFCILPALFFSFLKLSEKPSTLFFLACAFSTATLVLSHNLTTMITLPFIIVLILAVFRGKYFLGFSCVFLGLALSAFYWIPAVVEQKYININQIEFITQTYQNHLLTPLQIIGFEKTPWGFLPPVLGIGIFLGSVFTALVLTLQHLKFISKKGDNIFINFSTISFFICLFIASNLSRPLWELLSPPLNYLQFPWRFLTLATFFGAVNCAYLIYKTKPMRDKFMVIGLLTIPLIFSYHNYFQPVGYNFIAKYTADDPCGTAGWSNEYIPTWVKECYPKGAKLQPANVVAGDIKIKEFQLHQHSRIQQFKTQSTQSGKIVFNKYYFPGWQMKIDGKEASISATTPYGLIQTDILMGTHTLLLHFKDTPIRILANFLSIIGLLISIVLLLKFKTRF